MRALTALALLLVTACDKPTSQSLPDPGPPEATTTELEAEASAVPFADAEVFFERNTTDNDLGLQLFVDADGWRRLRVVDPDRREMLDILSQGRLSKLGITELRFESAEPSPNEVLALFPPGEYRFRGTTIEGTPLASVATLSHDFLPAPTFSPSNGEVVDPLQTVVQWNAPGAEQVEIIIEQDELEHVLDITLSGSTRRLRVPPQFLTPGKEYKIEILAISENGNRTLVESTFRTRS